jgi:hypothetical protein
VALPGTWCMLGAALLRQFTSRFCKVAAAIAVRPLRLSTCQSHRSPTGGRKGAVPAGRRSRPWGNLVQPAPTPSMAPIMPGSSPPIAITTRSIPPSHSTPLPPSLPISATSQLGLVSFSLRTLLGQLNPRLAVGLGSKKRSVSRFKENRTKRGALPVSFSGKLANL